MKLRTLGRNQTEIVADGVTVFFSYETPVACYFEGGRGHFRTTKRWSATTARHIKQWLSGAEAKEVPQATLDDMLTVSLSAEVLGQ